jgi:flagellar biosynthesis protein FlhF
MFAPDAPRAPIAWPEEEDVADEPVVAAPMPAPLPEPEVEILPPAPVAAAPAAAAPLPVPARSGSALPAHWPAGAGRLQSRLADRGVSEQLTSEVLDEAVTHLLPFSSHGRLKPLVASALARRIPVQPLHGAGGRVVGFVGPGGAGKTRSVARLAHAYAVRSQVPVACIALRAEDEGAELQRLVRPFGVNVHAIADAADARARIESFPADTLVLVDTPGVSPRAEAELRALAGELRQLRLDECHLAVPATMDRGTGRDLVEGTRPLGVDALAMTHADETERLGNVVELAIETQLPVSYIGRGTIVTGGLRPALPEELAAAVVA